MDHTDRSDGGRSSDSVPVTDGVRQESIAHSWSRTMQWCVKIAVGVGCAVAFNNFCASSPSADDSVRGAGSAVVAAVGAYLVNAFSGMLRSSERE